MFDDLDVPELFTAMADARHAERTAVARRVLAIGELCQRRMAGMATDQRANWCIDNWAATAAEVGAQLGRSREWASAQMNYGLELVDRLPRLAARFAAGEVDWPVVAAAVFRTELIRDRQIMARIDEVLARRVLRFNTLSRPRLAAAIDAWVSQLDPAAVRVPTVAENRYIEFGEARSGLVAFWGSVRAADAAVIEQRLDELAAAAPEESGTLDERRADALAALAAGGVPGTAENPVVITVVAESGTLAGTSERPGYLPGYGPVPPAMLRQLAQHARLRPLTPGPLLCAEPRYRPSAALAAFVRCRDLHCRFPGCDKPAEVCDLDHTVAYDDGGPTHPSNLALLCRAHHLIKTFYGGENGWRERQFADGTIEWTAPSGQTHLTRPTGALIFPHLGEPTGEITVETRRRRSAAGRTLMMPTRRRTRAAERAARIAWERGLNERRWAADPPPF